MLQNLKVYDYNSGIVPAMIIDVPVFRNSDVKNQNVFYPAIEPDMRMKMW